MGENSEPGARCEMDMSNIVQRLPVFGMGLTRVKRTLRWRTKRTQIQETVKTQDARYWSSYSLGSSRSGV